MPASVDLKMRWIHGRAARVIATVAAASALGALGWAPMDADAAPPTATVAYTTPGVYDFTVPAGISSISVTAVGAAGGEACNFNGGEGASVSATLAVSPGELLQVGVGAAGVGTHCSGAGPGGPGGGGDGGEGNDGVFAGAGGGGASALALAAPTPGFASEATLVVAGGGGGAAVDIEGGAAGVAGNSPVISFGGQGGGAGGLLAGGAGGTGMPDCGGEGTPASGTAGSFGLGGRGGSLASGSGAGGGGGGGGYYGGGGGGSGCLAGSGGGGSSYVTAAATVTEAPQPTSAAPEVAIAYAAPLAEASTSTLTFTGKQPQGVASAAQTVTVENGGAAPLVVSGYALSGSDPDDYLIDDGCQSAVPAGSSCRIGVRFDPQAQGASSATLTLQTNAATAALPIALSGEGGSLPQGPEGPKGATGPEGAAGPKGTTGAEGAPGPQGAAGTEGAMGPQGAQGLGGATGQLGPQGPQGPRGGTGPAGPAGQIQLVICTTLAIPAHGRHTPRKHALRRRCTSELEQSPATFTTTGTAHASLSRAGRLYASGMLADGRLALLGTRDLTPGLYTLTLRWRGAGVAHTSRQTLSMS
jgi:hypothetical protein